MLHLRLLMTWWPVKEIIHGLIKHRRSLTSSLSHCDLIRRTQSSSSVAIKSSAHSRSHMLWLVIEQIIASVSTFVPLSKVCVASSVLCFCWWLLWEPSEQRMTLHSVRCWGAQSFLCCLRKDMLLLEELFPSIAKSQSLHCL